jgi:lysophospholipase L1-like esterase
LFGWVIAASSLAAVGHAGASWAWAQRWHLSTRDAVVREAPDALTTNRYALLEGRAEPAIATRAPSRIEWALELRPGEHHLLASVAAEGPSGDAWARALVIEAGREREIVRADLTERPQAWDVPFSSRGGPIVLVLEARDAPPASWALFVRPRVIEGWSQRGLWIALALVLAAMIVGRTSFAPSGRWRCSRVVIRAWMVVIASAVSLAAVELVLRTSEPLRADIPLGNLDPDLVAELDPAPDVVSQERGYEPAIGRCFRTRFDGDGGAHRLAGYGEHVREIRACADERGFRRLDSAVLDPPVAVVGDSFVQAYNVTDAELWTEVLANRLRTSVGNYGVSGYGPQQELSVLRRDALRESTRLLVWAYFEGNDIVDASHFIAYRQSHLDWASFLSARSLTDRPSIRHRNHHLFLASGALQQAYDALSEPAPVTSACRAFNPVCSGTEGARLCMSFEPVYMERATWTADQWRGQRGWAPTLRILTGASRLVDRGGAAFVVVLIPSKESVYLSLVHPAASSAWFQTCVEHVWGRSLPAVTLDSLVANHRSQRDLLVSELEAAGIVVVDLYPVLHERAVRGEVLYYPHDSHFNAAGHTVVADHLATQLVRRGLWPR